LPPTHIVSDDSVTAAQLRPVDDRVGSLLPGSAGSRVCAINLAPASPQWTPRAAGISTIPSPVLSRRIV